MNRARWSGLAGLAATGAAQASDYAGVPTLIGIPVLLLALAAIGLFRLAPASTALNATATALFGPLLVLGVLVLADAIAVLESDLGMAMVYVALLAATGWALVRLVSRPIPASDADADADTDPP